MVMNGSMNEYISAIFKSGQIVSNSKKEKITRKQIRLKNKTVYFQLVLVIIFEIMEKPRKDGNMLEYNIQCDVVKPPEEKCTF